MNLTNGYFFAVISTEGRDLISNLTIKCFEEDLSCRRDDNASSISMI